MENYTLGMGYCGLLCQSCPIFLAARETDPDRQKRMRAEVARTCNQEYGLSLTENEINDCDGCRGRDGRIFTSCKDCRIRKCVMGKGIESCAGCNRYACEDLTQLFRYYPAARARLEALRAS